MATVLCMLTAHMLWNPVASLPPISPFSADLPSVPFSPLICISLPPIERTVCGAQRQKKAHQTQDLTERLQHPPGPAEPQHKHTRPLENRESIHPHAAVHASHNFPPTLLCSAFDLNSFHPSFPQILPLSLCLPMSSKMTSRPAPPPHPLSNTVSTNHQPFPLCQGSQETSYWVTSQLRALPLTTAPAMLRWGKHAEL